MACSCRTAPLRSFLSGLAQVHRLDASSSQPLLRSWSRASLAPSQYLEATALRHLRNFHATTGTAQEATGAVASQSAEPPTNHAHPPPLASSAVSDGIIESTSAQKPKKKKKQRWRDKDESELAKLKGEQAKMKERGAKNREKKMAKKMKDKAAGSDGFNTITEKKGVRTIRRKDGITISTRSYDNSKKDRSQTSPAGSSASADDIDISLGDEAGLSKGRREKLPDWRIQKESLRQKFPEGWRPRKRLSPDALAGIRALNAEYPEIYTTAALSAKFEVDPEAIRRILKSKWRPSAEEEEKRLERWQKRGMQIWETKAALGIKPPKQWRQEGITRDPSWHAWRRKVAEREKEWEDEEKRVYREKRAASLQSRVAGKVL